MNKLQFQLIIKVTMGFFMHFKFISLFRVHLINLIFDGALLKQTCQFGVDFCGIICWNVNSAVNNDIFWLFSLKNGISDKKAETYFKLLYIKPKIKLTWESEKFCIESLRNFISSFFKSLKWKHSWFCKKRKEGWHLKCCIEI